MIFLVLVAILWGILLCGLLVLTFYTVGFVKNNSFEDYVAKASNHNSLLFKIFTKKDKNLDKILAETTALCRLRGFKCPDLKIFYARRIVSSTCCAVICHSVSSIFVHKRITNRYSDDDLRILIGHEIGHAIYQNGSHSHPFLKRLSKITVNNEEVADYISVYLYGKEKFKSSYSRNHFQSTILDRLDSLEFSRTHLFLVEKSAS